MKKYSFKIRGNKYETEILKTERNIFEIEVNGTLYEVEYEHEIETFKTPKLIRSQVPLPQTKEKKIPKKISNLIKVNAPLPGLIIKILVKIGDKVKPRDVLLTMEAMKMENNIECEKSGTIKSIKVNEGDNVLQDDILIEIN
ncbi:MAG: biotin/lipoyl-containing protein [Bacteroidota bacterium]|nr:biotin/lipoyl-containing protein [Bacteroidota bacterium]